MFKLRLTISLACVLFNLVNAQDTLWSQKFASTAMKTWPAGNPISWNYEQGLIMKSIETIKNTSNTTIYDQYIKDKVNYFVNQNGVISTYSLSAYNLDNVASGRSLLYLYKTTGLVKYKTAATTLMSQLQTQPRTTSKGFWHKNIYPNQMWLDGLYMAQPFYTEYSNLFNEPSNLDDIALQFILMERKARDPNSGLLYHGWDESKAQAWANSVTGCSPSFWGRSVGWYAMGLVDVLEQIPTNYSKRDSLLLIYRRLTNAILNSQDSLGVWWQVLDKPYQAGNYREASASCMFVYALAKGIRLGYIDSTSLQALTKSYKAIIKQFVVTDAGGMAHLNGTCTATGLGGTPYRDGSYAYYTSVLQAQDDPKGVGAIILASVEMEKINYMVNVAAEDRIVGYTENTYPVPFHAKLNFQKIASDVEIFSASGILMYKGGEVETIDTSMWQSGLYIVCYRLPNSTIKVKIIKE